MKYLAKSIFVPEFVYTDNQKLRRDETVKNTKNKNETKEIYPLRIAL